MSLPVSPGNPQFVLRDGGAIQAGRPHCEPETELDHFRPPRNAARPLAQLASRVPQEATAFGHRRPHLLVEILATFVDRSDELEEMRHQRWARATLAAFDTIALPSGYPNMLAGDDTDRAAKSYGCNAERLIKAKRHYDPDNVFRSATPLPVARNGVRARAAANARKAHAPEDA